jgi:hypothetical protein
MPDTGENEANDGKRFPSDLSKSAVIKETADGFTYLDLLQFPEYFATDLSAAQAAFMARSQNSQCRGQLQCCHHHTCTAKQTKLDAGSGKGQNHEPSP